MISFQAVCHMPCFVSLGFWSNLGNAGHPNCETCLIHNPFVNFFPRWSLYSRTCLSGHLSIAVTCTNGHWSVTPLRFSYIIYLLIAVPAQRGHGQPFLRQCEPQNLLIAATGYASFPTTRPQTECVRQSN